MTTTDDALTEQIARALRRYDAETNMWSDRMLLTVTVRDYLPAAATVLPIIRKAERDAARGALDGFIAQEEASFLQLHVRGAVMSAEACSHARFSAEGYRDTHYPEETP